ncbi:MAG TPA: hypothetical protein VM935_09455 [Chitinophagaceae bacterium]|nr:hypothetical protein [Chitinophagaceae bacterium]
MQIRIIKKGHRNQLVCERRGKGNDVADIGPNLPFHDIAHFIVERQFKLAEGFFGNIYNGYSVKELSDKEVIKTLSKQSIISEVAARALQSFYSGACDAETFQPLMVEELSLYSLSLPFDLNPKQVNTMYLAYQDLITQWQALKEGAAMELELEIERWMEVPL